MGPIWTFIQNKTLGSQGQVSNMLTTFTFKFYQYTYAQRSMLCGQLSFPRVFFAINRRWEENSQVSRGGSRSKVTFKRLLIKPPMSRCGLWKKISSVVAYFYINIRFPLLILPFFRDIYSHYLHICSAHHSANSPAANCFFVCLSERSGVFQ